MGTWRIHHLHQLKLSFEQSIVPEKQAPTKKSEEYEPVNGNDGETISRSFSLAFIQCFHNWNWNTKTLADFVFVDRTFSNAHIFLSKIYVFTWECVRVLSDCPSKNVQENRMVKSICEATIVSKTMHYDCDGSSSHSHHEHSNGLRVDVWVNG